MRIGSSPRAILAIVLFVGVLCISAVAIAAIPSGGYTFDQSNQVTYTEVEIARPSVSVGDLMLAAIAVNGGGSAVLNSAPTGWTLIASTSNDTNITLRSYYRVAAASDTSTSTYLWRFVGQTTAEGAIIPYSGVDVSTTSPIDTLSENTGFGSLATTSSITTNAANEAVVALFAIDVGRNANAGSYFSTSTTPYGMTKKYDLSNTPFGPSIAAMEVIFATASNSGSASTTISGNKARYWAAHMIALRKGISTATLDASGTWTAPTGVTSVTVDMWGVEVVETQKGRLADAQELMSTQPLM